MNSPLYLTGLTPDGVPLYGGFFEMQDREGFPLDASWEECRARGLHIDWLEALCKCWLNDVLKFESFVKHAEILEPEAQIREKFKATGALVLAENPEMKSEPNPVSAVCEHILKIKHAFTANLAPTP